MGKARTTKKKRPAAEDQRARDLKMDEIFADKPSLKQLRESGELSGDPLPGDVFHQLRAVRWALRKERERQGLSQEAVAEAAGIDGPALSRIESGRVLQPTLGTLSRIADALGFDFAIALKARATTTPVVSRRASSHGGGNSM